MDENNIAVFCGSKEGSNKAYLQQAAEIGQLLAQHQFGLIYGGGNKGLMGAVADAVLLSGGRAIGIMPERLAEWNHSHQGLTELVVVPDMHVRKRMMYERCRAAIVLSGGFGTMDELFEMLTWNQLAIHDKPIFILNTEGFYTQLFEMMQTMHLHGFLHEPLEKRVKIFADTGALMAGLVTTFVQ